jgi:gamma-glutamylcysteine synthetase
LHPNLKHGSEECGQLCITPVFDGSVRWRTLKKSGRREGNFFIQNSYHASVLSLCAMANITEKRLAKKLSSFPARRNGKRYRNQCLQAADFASHERTVAARMCRSIIAQQGCASTSLLDGGTCGLRSIPNAGWPGSPENQDVPASGDGKAPPGPLS